MPNRPTRQESMKSNKGKALKGPQAQPNEAKWGKPNKPTSFSIKDGCKWEASALTKNKRDKIQITAAETVWERKKARREERRQHCNGQSITNLYPANVRTVSPRLKGLQRVWFGGGGKRAYFQYLAMTSFGRCFVGKHLYPKQVVNWLGSLDA